MYPGPGSREVPFILRGDAGEGYIRALVAIPGSNGRVQLEVMHTSDAFCALRFCTAKAALRFAVAVASHYPYTRQGRYTAIRG